MSAFFRTSRALPTTLLSSMAVAALLATGAARADTFLQTYEAPGVEHTTATLAGGVENFDSLSTGIGGFVSNFGGSTYTGTYSATTEIDAANVYGSAGGVANHANATTSAGYSITLDKSANYFGYWLSALDAGNVVDFYNGSTLVGTLGAAAVLDSIVGNSAYFGNPDAPFTGGNTVQPYAFVNFYDTTGSFNSIVFREDPEVGGYESDNHTVGVFKDIGGTPVTPAVPEPGTYALMLFGLGAVAALLRRRPER